MLSTTQKEKKNGKISNSIETEKKTFESVVPSALSLNICKELFVKNKELNTLLDPCIRQINDEEQKLIEIVRKAQQGVDGSSKGWQDNAKEIILKTKSVASEQSQYQSSKLKEVKLRKTILLNKPQNHLTQEEKEEIRGLKELEKFHTMALNKCKEMLEKVKVTYDVRVKSLNNVEQLIKVAQKKGFDTLYSLLKEERENLMKTF